MIFLKKIGIFFTIKVQTSKSILVELFLVVFFKLLSQGLWMANVEGLMFNIEINDKNLSLIFLKTN